MHKKIIIFVLLLLSFSFSFVKADCTNEDISNLKKKVNQVKVTYKHLGPTVTQEGETVYYLFDLTFKNLNPDMYIRLEDYNEEWKQENNNGTITFRIMTGKYDFSIYSLSCNKEIDKIKVTIPKFNIYSLDPLCEGIDGEDFALCDKYYNYDISYENFEQRVKKYRNTHSLDKQENNTNTPENNILKTLQNFFVKYKLYLIVSLIAIILVTFIIIIISKKKKRGVLE